MAIAMTGKTTVFETYANEASREITNPETSEPVVIEQYMEATEQGINIYEYVEEQWFKIVIMILFSRNNEYDQHKMWSFF